MSNSSRRMCALTAGCVSSNRCAALVKLPELADGDERAQQIGRNIGDPGGDVCPRSRAITPPVALTALRIRVLARCLPFCAILVL